MYPSNQKASGEEHYDPQPPSSPHIATGIPMVSGGAAASQPQFTPPLSRPENLVPWSTGLFDCFKDTRNCCVTCWCPYITFGQIAEILDEGSMTCSMSAALYAVIMFTTGHACMYSCMYRSKMRRLYMLQPTPCDDCLVHWCCECCALCQEYRELQNRGFDMIIGWQGNVGRQTPGVVAMASMAPTVESGMRR